MLLIHIKIPIEKTEPNIDIAIRENSIYKFCIENIRKIKGIKIFLPIPIAKKAFCLLRTRGIVVIGVVINFNINIVKKN